MSRKLELWVEIHELNEQGEYVPVEVAPKPEVLTGGVFQLRQVEFRRYMKLLKLKYTLLENYEKKKKIYVIVLMYQSVSVNVLIQGHSRRILAHVKPVQNSGTLPIIVESILHVAIGCVTARSKLQKGLDSYQVKRSNNCLIY